VDDRGGRSTGFRDALLPGLVVVHRRGPGDVVNGAGAADAALVRAVVGVEPAAPLSPHLPGVFAPWVELERVLEAATALLGVDGRVVLVDALLDEPQAEHGRVEVDVAGRVARDRGDVVNAFELHTGRLADAGRAPGRVEDAGEAADPRRAPTSCRHGHEPGRVTLAAEREAARKGDPGAVRRPGRVLVVGLARRQPGQTG